MQYVQQDGYDRWLAALPPQRRACLSSPAESLTRIVANLLKHSLANIAAKCIFLKDAQDAVAVS